MRLQTPSLLPRLTVSELLDHFGSFFARTRPVDELVGMRGLEDSRDRLAGTLFGGRAQRLSIALALVNRPEVVFLDEPTTGLDPQARVHLWELIEGARTDGTTVLLTAYYSVFWPIENFPSPCGPSRAWSRAPSWVTPCAKRWSEAPRSIRSGWTTSCWWGGGGGRAGRAALHVGVGPG